MRYSARRTSGTTRPPAPSIFSEESVTETSFTLVWNAVTGATAYQVYRDWQPISLTEETSLSVTGLAPGITYGMTVRARNAAGVWSVSSSIYPVTTAVTLPVPSFTATPSGTIRAGYDGASVALAGTNTAWGPDTSFTVSAGTIVSVTRTSATSVTLLFNAPITAATITVSDGTSTAQFSVAAAVAVVTDWEDLDLQLVAIGSSAQATVATPSSDEVAQIFATASGCPAGRFFLRAANGNSIDGMTSQITAAIAAGEITDRSIVTVDVGTIINTAYGDPTIIADPVQCSALVATWGIQVDRILATGARVLILEAPSLNYVHASDGGAELRTQSLLWMAAHDPPLSSATDYTPVHGLTGASATYYIEQDTPPGPHLNETGANLITPILTYRLSRIAADIGYAVTMTATPAAPVVANTSDNVINLAGSHTAWGPGTTFSITSGGGTITATTITDADTAQVTYTSAGSGTVTISDGTTTATFTVESATSVLWADPFDGSGALDAGWLAGNGATGVRDAGSLRRTDVGDFRTLYNLAGGALPAQYSVRWTVAPSFVMGTGYRGLLGYVTGNGTGRGVFWPGTSRNNYSYNEGTFGSSVAFTYVADPPASWALDNQDHTIELRFTTNLVSLYLDDTLVGTHSAGADATATGVGTIGDGQYDQVTNYFVVRGVEVLSI